MRIEIRARVECAWCDAKAETWADARLGRDGDSIESIDVQTPKGWARHEVRTYDTAYEFACSAHFNKR